MATYTTLDSLFTAIANTIRSKKQTVGTIKADDFPAEIATIETGGTYQSKTVTPTASGFTVTPDANYDAMTSVTVNGDSDLVAGNIVSGKNIFGVTGTYAGIIPSGTIVLTSLGTFNVYSYANAQVSISTYSGGWSYY